MSKCARVSLPVAGSSPAATLRRVIARATSLGRVASPAAAGAQAWAYPAFQPPRVMNREFNFGVADADTPARAWSSSGVKD